jgi:hypothetical protein
VINVEAPDAKKSSRSFGPVEDTKEVLIDPSSTEDKAVCVGTALSSK